MTDLEVMQRLSDDNCRLKDIIFEERARFRLLQDENKRLIERINLMKMPEHGDARSYIGKLESIIAELTSSEYVQKVHTSEFTKKKYLDRAIQQKKKWKQMYLDVCAQFNIEPKTIEYDNATSKHGAHC